MPADISSRPGRRARNIARAALACSVMMLAVWTSGAAVIRTGELDGGQLPAPIQLGEPLPLGAAGVVERLVAVAPRAVVKTTAKKTSTRRTSTKSASKTRTKTKTATRTSSRTASRTASRSITAAFVPESEDFGGLTRDEAVRLYKTYYAIPQPAMSYTGNATSCEGGTTSDDYKKDVENRLNYYRLSAGLLPVKLNYTLSANSQYAAMMMSRNKQLSHYPPSSWACYTFDAAIQAVSSNLALGLQGRGAIDVYVNEPPGLGHRNWCLDSTLATFATGDTPSTNVDGVSYPATNVLKVLGTVQRYTDYGNLTRDKGTYWPPRGWIPTPVVPNYWSIIKDGWTFADAVVTMYKNGAVVPVTTRHDSSWEAKQLIWTKPNVSPLEGDYTVVIQNGTKDGVPRQTLAYYVHVFNPDTPFTTRTTITSTRSVTRTSSTSKTMSTITQPANMVKFTGTVIGTLGTYGGGLDRTKCYDGDTSTAFDAASSNGVWCGLDFGTKKSVYVIKFHPRANQLGRMLGGKFQVSSTADFSSDVETLYSVDSTPSLQWYTVVAKMATTYQYARYLSPNGGWGNIAEVEFWGL